METWRLGRLLGLWLLLAGALGVSRPTLAEGTPTAASPRDLAALTIRPVDLGQPGWVHEGAFTHGLAGQAETHAGYLGSGTTAEAVSERLGEAGWEQQYVSVLGHIPDDPSGGVSGEADARIRSYVTRYGSADGAAMGFTFLEDESGVTSAVDTPTSRRHGEAWELTEERGVTGGEAKPFRSLDLTFRTGALVAGVSLVEYGVFETFEMSRALVEQLADEVEARIVADAEIGLGGVVLRLASSTPNLVTYDDAYYRLGGVDVPLGGETVAAARLRIETYAAARDVYQLWQGAGADSGVLFGVTLLRFEDEVAAADWVLGLESTLAEHPFYGDLRYETGTAGAGLGDDAVALSYVAGGGGGSAPRSVLAAVRVGADVARVHLAPQGGTSTIPLDPALELARIQATCLRDGACGETGLPGGLTSVITPPTPAATPLTTPAASPEAAELGHESGG